MFCFVFFFSFSSSPLSILRIPFCNWVGHYYLEKKMNSWLWYIFIFINIGAFWNSLFSSFMLSGKQECLVNTLRIDCIRLPVVMIPTRWHLQQKELMVPGSLKECQHSKIVWRPIDSDSKLFVFLLSFILCGFHIMHSDLTLWSFCNPIAVFCPCYVPPKQN